MPSFYCLVDDSQKDGSDYATVLSARNLKVEHRCPEPAFAFLEDVLKREDMVGMILDYKLSYADPGISYDAPALAWHVREKKPDIPIIALSGVPSVSRKLKAAYGRTEYRFDWFLDKSEVSISAELARRQLVSLNKGYIKLAILRDKHESADKALQKILGLQEDPEGLCSWLAAETEREPYLAARFIIHQLLRWPGPLLPFKHAAVFLGSSPFSNPNLKKMMHRAVYRGPFPELYEEPRYWTHMLATLNPKKGSSPAVCKASGGKANTICDACDEPFDSFFTVGVKRVGAAPPVENGRVCGICLQGELEDLTVRQESWLLVKNVIAETKAALEKQHNAAKR